MPVGSRRQDHRDTGVLGVLPSAAPVIPGGAVDKHVASIFGKLGLPPSEGGSRRALSALRCLAG
jgi:hypothetical protein